MTMPPIERPEDAAGRADRREAAGPAPQLAWLEIASLVVDPAYQRPITSTGRVNVGKIVADFRWARFSPVIVSPVEGGLYAIIDGQHRTTAAAAIGIESVPCQIVLATRGEQAEAFTAINGAVTRVHRLAIHRAAVAAGDPAAVAIDHVASRAGVQILGYPVAELRQEPGQTMAVGAIADAIAKHGAEVVTLALRCIRTTRNDVRGGVLAPIVTAVAAVVRELKGERLPDDQILALFGGVLLIRELDKARLTPRDKGIATHVVLAERLRAAMRKAGERTP